MTHLIECDRCKRIIGSRATLRAFVSVDVLGLPDDDGKNKRREYFDVDLCEDCLRDLYAFLGMEVPE